MTTTPIPSITDEQIAEIELMASESCQYAGGDWFKAVDLSAWFADDDAQFMAAASPFALRALISRLRAAERDAQRYRWLRTRLVGASFDWDDDGMTVLAFEMPSDLSISADCDANIDAAMTEAKP